MENTENMEQKIENIIQVDIEKEMQKSFLDYSMSVIVSRAIPDVRDGLKPVHRRILYSQFEDNLYPEKPYKKCATTVGNVLGRYHPHGDSSVYDALVRLAQDFSMRYPLVDGHGNFGSVDGDPPAAYRYTESKMSKISVEMLTDIDKQTVDFGSNYDDTRKEPTVLPSRFPNLLVNGSTGIAVGMATNIPPHNMGEVIDAVCCMIDNKDASLADIMEHIKGPDFPTGGLIMGRSGIRAAYSTGKGKIYMRAKTEIEENPKTKKAKIKVTELPYQVNKARLIKFIADLVKDKKIEGIANIDDHSDRNGMLIEIDLKRDANPQVVLNNLFNLTAMQSTFGVIMLAIVNGEPKTLTLKEILTEYVNFQKDVIVRRTRFNLKKAEERAHILEGLKIALDHINEVIETIKKSKDQPEAKMQLIEKFGLDEIQAQAIVQMRLGQLSGLERKKIEDELLALLEKIADYKDILANEYRVLEILKEELIKIKNKYADPRRTEIMSVGGEVDIEDLIPQEDCVLTMTRFGYVKRLKEDTYHTQNRGGRGVTGMTTREEDTPAEMLLVNSHENIMFFTDKGKAYKLKCYSIPEASRTSKGMNIANLLPLERDEKVSAMLKVPKFEEDKFLVFVTRKGIIKRTKLTDFASSRKGGIKAIHLDDDDELCWVKLTDGNSQLLIATRGGRIIRIKESDVRTTSRSSRGIIAMRLKSGDEVIGMSRLREGAKVLTVSETGFGRLSDESDFRLQSRGGMGVTNYHVDKYGKVAAIRVVDLDEDVIIISQNGVVIRIRVDSIRECARPSKGVKIMKIVDGNKIIAMTRAAHTNSEESEEENDIQILADDE